MMMNVGTARYALRGAGFHSSAARQAKRTVAQLTDEVDLRGRNVLVRADLNVPLSKDGSGTITDDTRIRACLPTVQHLTSAGARVVLCSHFARPKGKVVEEMRLTPVRARLEELLEQEVALAPDCVGPEVRGGA